MVQTLIGRVAEIAKETPDREALVFRKESVTYGELLIDAKRIAGRLMAEGIKPGDTVLCQAPSRPLTMKALLGIQYAGAAAVMIDKNAEGDSITPIYEDSSAVLLLSHVKAEKVPEGIRSIALKDLLKSEDEPTSAACAVSDPEMIAELIFTTGTTGRPKGVMLSHRAVMSIAAHTAEGIGITSEDRILMPLPLHHSYALRVIRATLTKGGVIVFQNGFTFASEIEKNLNEQKCTGIAVVPVSMELLRAQMQEHFYEIMGRFRYIEVGAGALTVEQRKRLTKNLPNTQIYNTWGSSETGGALFTHVNEVAVQPNRVSTLGRPLPDIEIKVLGPDNEPIVSDHEHPGRLALRGEMVMSGYCGRPDLTADALQDGWLVTNDLVYVDEDGYVFMLGRSDDIINVGGEKVSPIEVENIACEFPNIRECICIGVPDEKTGLGQVPILCAAVDEGFSEAELRTYLAGKMERFKIPVYYIYVDAVPRNRMQKPDRKGVRALWDARE